MKVQSNAYVKAVSIVVTVKSNVQTSVLSSQDVTVETPKEVIDGD